jgi:hypothetical protein
MKISKESNKINTNNLIKKSIKRFQSGNSLKEKEI